MLEGEENHVKFYIPCPHPQGAGETGRGNRKSKSPKVEMSLGKEVREVDGVRPGRSLLEFYSQG